MYFDYLAFHSNFKISVTLGGVKTNIFKKANYATLISEKKTHHNRGTREEIKKVEKWQTLMIKLKSLVIAYLVPVIDRKLK